MPTVNEIAEKLGDQWPQEEPLDLPNEEISTLYSEVFVDYDANAYEDWMARVADHYPELYFSMNPPVSTDME